MTKQALIIGGTGMLAGCTHRLAEDGWQVVLPSRRQPGRAGRGVVPVAADWSAPERFVARVSAALTRPVELLISWVHTPWREPVLEGCAPLLAADASAVEVWASATADPVRSRPEPVLGGWRCHQVLLGYQRANGRSRWLTDKEISDGVYGATLTALSGEASRVHEVGLLRPWAEHP